MRHSGGGMSCAADGASVEAVIGSHARHRTGREFRPASRSCGGSGGPCESVDRRPAEWSVVRVARSGCQLIVFGVDDARRELRVDARRMRALRRRRRCSASRRLSAASIGEQLAVERGDETRSARRNRACVQCARGSGETSSGARSCAAPACTHRCSVPGTTRRRRQRAIPIARARSTAPDGSSREIPRRTLNAGVARRVESSARRLPAPSRISTRDARTRGASSRR